MTQLYAINPAKSEKENLIDAINSFKASGQINITTDIVEFTDITVIDNDDRFNKESPNENVVNNTQVVMTALGQYAAEGSIAFQYRRINIAKLFDLKNGNSYIPDYKEGLRAQDYFSKIPDFIPNQFQNSFNYTLNEEENTITMTAKEDSLLFTGSVTARYLIDINKLAWDMDYPDTVHPDTKAPDERGNNSLLLKNAVWYPGFVVEAEYVVPHPFELKK